MDKTHKICLNFSLNTHCTTNHPEDKRKPREQANQKLSLVETEHKHSKILSILVQKHKNSLSNCITFAQQPVLKTRNFLEALLRNFEVPQYYFSCLYTRKKNVYRSNLLIH